MLSITDSQLAELAAATKLSLNPDMTDAEIVLLVMESLFTDHHKHNFLVKHNEGWSFGTLWSNTENLPDYKTPLEAVYSSTCINTSSAGTIGTSDGMVSPVFQDDDGDVHESGYDDDDDVEDNSEDWVSVQPSMPPGGMPVEKYPGLQPQSASGPPPLKYGDWMKATTLTASHLKEAIITLKGDSPPPTTSPDESVVKHPG